MIRLQPLIFILISLALLAACTEPPSTEPTSTVPLDTFGVPTRWEGAPPTWREWVDNQRPLRERLFDAYRPAYIPDMSRWQPKDFLPAEYLNLPMRDGCELPDDEYRALLNLDVNNPDQLNRLKAYAEQGYIQAMVQLGRMFCNFPPPDARLSVYEGWQWARRAAASGEPRAMFVLGACMENIYFRKGAGITDAELGFPIHRLERRSFWIDELLYWYWRSAQALNPFALHSLYYSVDNFYFPDSAPGGERNTAIERYKWRRLGELGSALYGEHAGLSLETMSKRFWPDMTAADKAEAERHVETFLRKYGGGLKHARFQGISCAFDGNFQALNAELQKYGLKVDPPQNWMTPKYPLPPLPRPLE